MFRGEKTILFWTLSTTTPVPVALSSFLAKSVQINLFNTLGIYYLDPVTALDRELAELTLY